MVKPSTTVQDNQLEVSVAMGAHLHCPRFTQPSKCGIYHRVIPRLLATCCLWQPERLQHVGRQTPGYVEVLGDLVFCDGVTRSRTEKAIGWAVVIAQLSELRLHGLNRGVSHRYSVINGPGVIVIVLRNVSNGVIIWVVIAGVIRQVVPRKES